MRDCKSQAKRKLLILFPFILLLLSGCLGQNRWVWQHPEGFGDQQRQQDIALCEKIANEETRWNDYYYPYPFYYFDRHSPHNEPYLHWPYFYRFNSHRELQDRQRYFRICMKSKGWQLVKIPIPQPDN